MKFIHTADLHIGSAMTTHFSADKARIRRHEVTDTFVRLCVFASENNVDAVIISGDFFDTPDAFLSVKNDIKTAISAAQPVLFFYAGGNHDKDFDYSDFPENFRCFSADWQTFDFDTLTVSGINVFDTTDADFYQSLKLDSKKFNIVSMHGDIGADISLNKLSGKNIDYLALGHIHLGTVTPKKLDTRGVYGYPGCLEGRGFDEAGEKGFFLFEVNDGRLGEFSFVPFSKRIVRIVEADITGCDSFVAIKDKVYASLAGVPKDDIIKLVLTGGFVEGTVKAVDVLSDSLNRDFFFCKVQDKSKLLLEPNDYQNDISLKGEFLRLVFSQDLPDTEKQQIADFGLKALLGEDIDV